MASLKKVIDSGNCVGCGACSVITNGLIDVEIDSYGCWTAALSDTTPELEATASRVCPFADESPDETQIAAEAFADLPSDSHLGRYLSVFAAQVNDEQHLLRSSSGGLTSWLVHELMSLGLVDGVIHVGQHDQGELFSYQVSYTTDQVLARRKSVYYSVSMAEAIMSIRGDERRYVLVGVPCFITAARHLSRNDPVLREQLAYFVGLVCGHLKSAAFAELLVWQVQFPPHELAAVDFRVKSPAKGAGSYDFRATSSDGRTRTSPTNALVGGNWGHGLFQLNACSFCDDIFGETADIVIGDAWLPEFESDWRGHNIVVTRDAALGSLIDQGAKNARLLIHKLEPERAIESQAGNFRHRREGLRLRLYDDQREGLWTPRKRVAPSNQLPKRRQRIVRTRR